MAKKMISMKFEPEFLERLEVFLKSVGVDRTTFFTGLAETAMADGRYATGGVVKSTKTYIVGEQPSEQTIKREPTENALKRQVSFDHHAQQVMVDGPVDVSSLDIASWGFKRPVAPKKGK